MSGSEIFRQNAVTERAAANATLLPNRRAMHERSAEVWDEMASAIEDTRQRARINASAKQGTVYNGQRKADRQRAAEK